LKDNEVNRKIFLNKVLRDKEEDIKANAEFAKVLERQEFERNNFIKSKQKVTNDSNYKLVDEVLRNMEHSKKQEDQKIQDYEHLKERQ